MAEAAYSWKWRNDTSEAYNGDEDEEHFNSRKLLEPHCILGEINSTASSSK
jgi:hypothetical protein